VNYEPSDDRLPRYYLGCDLGQTFDYTAIVGVEALTVSAFLDKNNPEKQKEADEAEIRVVLCERGQEAYNKIAERLKTLVETPHLGTPWKQQAIYGDFAVVDEGSTNPHLAVDATGVGRGVVDLLRNYELEFYAVQLTNGLKTHREAGFWNVPKRDLVSLPIVAFQNGWIKLAEGLSHRDQLEHELANYRTKVNLRTGHESFEAWRDRDHDDLVLALALAMWATLRARVSWKRRALSGIYTYESLGLSR
jgi:hypothetical protein